MEYTITSLARMAGITTRTLRHYDSIGLLKPKRTSSSGIRIYSGREVDLLQNVLFFKALGFELARIKELMDKEGFDEVASLIEHRERLIRDRENLDLMIATLDRSIEARRGNIKMKDREKFKGLKQSMVDENERKYGKDRQKFGDETVDKSNDKVLSMSEADHERSTMISTEIITKIHEAMKTGDPDSELAQEAARLHREWLSYYWHDYSVDAHMGLVQMYVEDERFKSFYDSETEGTAAFLRDAVISYLKRQQNKDSRD